MSYARATPPPKAAQVIPSANAVSPPTQTARAIPSRTLIKRQPFRRAGDDSSDHVPQLLLTAEEMRDEKMTPAFWNPQPDPEAPQPHALLDYSIANRNKPFAIRHTIHEIDRAKSAEEVLSANNGLSWSQALFGPEGKRLGVFFSPFQRQMFHAQEKEVRKTSSGSFG